MEAVLSNVNKATTYIYSDAMDVNKDAFIEYLKFRLQGTLTIYYVIADQHISENGKDCNLDVKKQIENFEKSLKPIRSRSQTLVPEKPDTSLSVVHLIKNPLFIDWRNSTNNFAQSCFSIFKTKSPSSNFSIQTEPSIRVTRFASTQTIQSALTNTSTQTVSSVFGTIGIETDSTVNKSSRVQDDLPRQKTPSTAKQTNAVTDNDVWTNLTIVGTSANGTSNESLAVQVNSVARKTVEIQTEFESTVEDILKLNGKITVDQLSNKFGRGGDSVVPNNCLNLKAILNKIGLTGFKSLSIQQLAFIHQHIIENTSILCKKYTSFIEIAVKHLPSWQRGSIKQKQDIILIFAMVDRLMEIKNKEIDVIKNNLTTEMKKSSEIEKQLLSVKTKCRESIVESREIQKAPSRYRNDGLNNETNNNFVQRCSELRFTYNELISEEFLKSLSDK